MGAAFAVGAAFQGAGGTFQGGSGPAPAGPAPAGPGAGGLGIAGPGMRAACGAGDVAHGSSLSGFAAGSHGGVPETFGRRLTGRGAGSIAGPLAGLEVRSAALLLAPLMPPGPCGSLAAANGSLAPGRPCAACGRDPPGLLWPAAGRRPAAVPASALLARPTVGAEKYACIRSASPATAFAKRSAPGRSRSAAAAAALRARRRCAAAYAAIIISSKTRMPAEMTTARSTCGAEVSAFARAGDAESVRGAAGEAARPTRAASTEAVRMAAAASAVP